MKRVIVEAEVSLDGVFGDGPDFWAQVFKYHSADLDAYLRDLLFSADALLAGRKTYEAFAHVWPSRTGDVAERINAMPKYVASRSLKAPLDWNATLIEGDVATLLRDIKQEPGRDLVQYGVGELTRTMLQHGVVDEIRLVVFPFVVGRGPRVFESFDAASFELLDTTRFSSGAIALHYHPSSQ
jgi:dihydrofolate reductase